MSSIPQSWFDPCDSSDSDISTRSSCESLVHSLNDMPPEIRANFDFQREVLEEFEAVEVKSLKGRPSKATKALEQRKSSAVRTLEAFTASVARSFPGQTPPKSASGNFVPKDTFDYLREDCNLRVAMLFRDEVRKRTMDIEWYRHMEELHLSLTPSFEDCVDSMHRLGYTPPATPMRLDVVEERHAQKQRWWRNKFSRLTLYSIPTEAILADAYSDGWICRTHREQKCASGCIKYTVDLDRNPNFC